MSEKRYSWADAMAVADEIVKALRPWCERIEIAGSLRREKETVGDIEILYIPIIRVVPHPFEMFSMLTQNKADEQIAEMEKFKTLERRRNIKGSEVFGEKNKLMRHVASGIPVDLFSATQENWYNYLVCRTGPADLNKLICNRAITKGWHWMPYGVGFQRETNEKGVHIINTVHSEQEVFAFVALQYLEPAQRELIQTPV
jgi:DNA polymerase (family 10)